MILLISYDLNGRERPSAYAAIKRAIEEGATSSIHPLYSQWLVETNADPDAWASHLEGHRLVDKNDRLLIIPVTRPYQGWLEASDWVWLSTRI